MILSIQYFSLSPPDEGLVPDLAREIIEFLGYMREVDLNHKSK